MQLGTLCQRLVFTICQSDEISRAAQVMREKHVGYLLVVEPNPVRGIPRPVGVLTDREIVVGGIHGSGAAEDAPIRRAPPAGR